MSIRRLGLALLVWAAVCGSCRSQSGGEIAVSEAEVSYVMEPFEAIDRGWYRNRRNNRGFLNMSIANEFGDALFGNGALRVDYNVHKAPNEDTVGSVEFGFTQPSIPHNCYGASYMSLWYKVLKPQSLPGAAKLGLVLLDDSDCHSQCVYQGFLENHYSFHDVLGNDNGVWNEIQIPLQDESFALMPLLGAWNFSQVGNDYLDTNRIRGWGITLLVEDSLESSTTTSGSIMFDHLSCVGSGDLLGAAFHILHNTTFEDAAGIGQWDTIFYNSEIAVNRSTQVLKDGVLDLAYTVQVVESWGGFNSFTHIAPDPAYYNLSQASDLKFSYATTKEASLPGRVHLRLVLSDGADCDGACFAPLLHERYYSFNYILDEIGEGDIILPLQGDPNPQSPFWLTGWAGVFGNQVLNPSVIKGFTLEINIDSQLEILSTVSGAFQISDMTAVNTRIIEEGEDIRKKCIEVVDVAFNVASGAFQRLEFLGSKCCETCDKDAECLYAMSNGRDCFVASHLQEDSILYFATDIERASITSFWMDDETKRGDFCSVCECREADLTIDCRDRDLKIIPKTFTTNLTDTAASWKPRVLDLRGNPNLIIMGQGALNAISGILEELRLPDNMVHIAPETLLIFPRLSSVKFEADMTGGDDDSGLVPRNVLVKPDQAFSDFCCTPGRHIDLAFPASGLTFCELREDTFGVDAIYEPFIRYDGASVVNAIKPSSPFMAEAAESVDKCAEYCSITTRCNYFSYDARLPNAEHICYLLSNPGSESVGVCCNVDHYADPQGTIPGWVSGRPAKTRHFVDNATVLRWPIAHTLTVENNYETEFELSLGATPIRGAVWIEPRLATTSTLLNVTITPPRVVLYDVNVTARVHVKVTNVGSMYEDITILNRITSCDVAFSTGTSADYNVIIEIIPPADSDSITLIVVVVVLVTVVALMVGLFVYFDQQRKKNDSIWKIAKEDLVFADPVEVLGRGTFGLVLLAEYRGTQVAVKRVIPPKASTKRSSTTTSSVGDVESQSDAGTSSGGMFGHSSAGKESTFGAHMSGLMSGARSMSRLYSVFRRDEALWRKLKEDFVAEMRILSKLRHPCITTIMGAVMKKNEEPMLVMEYMDHGSLYDLLHNETMILEGELILPILRDIAQGMRFLHTAEPQIVHGDLKAQNILVDNRFRGKVADFGLTQKKNMGATGTPFWMAPELLRGDVKENTASSDVYSFGIILYEVYSRRDPYEGEDAKAVLAAVMDKNVNKRPPVPKDSPPQMQNLMQDCLVGEPDERPTFEELDNRLKRVSAESVAPAQSTRSLRKPEQSNVSLLDIFPKHIAEALRDGKKVEPEHRDVVTIFFSDIVGFTSIATELPPQKVANMLGRLYTTFDDLSDKHDIFKVETIGDAYMAVTNLVKDQPNDHVKRIAKFAIDAVQAASETLIDDEEPEKGYLRIRVGFHSGPVVADVVGTRSPRYCLFGDTVNTASRMESNSLANRIQCSERAAELLLGQCEEDELTITPRGPISIKGKGKMTTYWVEVPNQLQRNSVGFTAASLDKSPAEAEGRVAEPQESKPEEKIFGNIVVAEQLEDSNEMYEDAVADGAPTKNRMGHSPLVPERGTGHVAEQSATESKNGVAEPQESWQGEKMFDDIVAPDKLEYIHKVGENAVAKDPEKAPNEDTSRDTPMLPQERFVADVMKDEDATTGQSTSDEDVNEAGVDEQNDGATAESTPTDPPREGHLVSDSGASLDALMPIDETEEVHGDQETSSPHDLDPSEESRMKEMQFKKLLKVMKNEMGDNDGDSTVVDGDSTVLTELTTVEI